MIFLDNGITFRPLLNELQPIITKSTHEQTQHTLIWCKTQDKRHQHKIKEPSIIEFYLRISIWS